MALPELIYAPIDGGTIHRYEISGGKRKFLRFIGCYLGQCNFHKNIDDATDYIKNLKELQKIQNSWNKDKSKDKWIIIFNNDMIIATNNRELYFYEKLIIYLGYSSDR